MFKVRKEVKSMKFQANYEKSKKKPVQKSQLLSDLSNKLV